MSLRKRRSTQAQVGFVCERPNYDQLGGIRQHCWDRLPPPRGGAEDRGHHRTPVPPAASDLVWSGKKLAFAQLARHLYGRGTGLPQPLQHFFPFLWQYSRTQRQDRGRFVTTMRTSLPTSSSRPAAEVANPSQKMLQCCGKVPSPSYGHGGALAGFLDGGPGRRAVERRLAWKRGRWRSSVPERAEPFSPVRTLLPRVRGLMGWHVRLITYPDTAPPHSGLRPVAVT